MVWSSVHYCAVLEILVMVFQVFGVAAPCMSRLLPSTRCAETGRVGVIIARAGLGGRRHRRGVARKRGGWNAGGRPGAGGNGGPRPPGPS